MGEPGRAITEATVQPARHEDAVPLQALAAVARRTAHAVVLIDRGGRIEWVNQAFETLSGWDADAVCGQPYASVLFGPAADPDTAERIRGSIAAGEAIRGRELLCHHRDGRPYWVELELQAITDAAGQPVRFMLIESEITLRKAAQQAQREAQAKLNAAFQGSTECMTIERLADGVLVEANEAFERLSGYRRSAVIGRSASELGLWAAPQERERFVAELERLGSVRDHVCAWRARHGELRDCLISATCIDIGAEPHIVAVVRDLTEQHRTERALRESQARFAAAFRQSADYMSIVRLSDRVIVEVNDNCKLVSGFARDEMIGRTAEELSIWPDPAERRALLEAITRDGLVRDMEVELRRRDGRTVKALFTASMLDIDGEPHMMCIVRDVTEARLAQQALVESEARMRLMFENAVEAMVVIDEYGRIEQFNAASERLFGYRGAEVIGGNVSMLMPESHRAAHDAHLQRHRRSGLQGVAGTIREVLAQRKNGEVFPIELSVSELMTAAGRRFSGTVRDITARREVEQAARRLTEELRASVAELECINRENGMLGEMRDMLQTCQSLDETYAVASRFVRILFPQARGALYMRTGERDLFESCASWGDASASEVVFEAGACWGLRRGRVYHYGSDAYDLCCGHVDEAVASEYVCVPLTAQGETIGMLHLEGELGARRDPVTGGESAELGRLRRLTETFTEYVSLAIANVRLRETLRRQAIRDTCTGLFNRRFLEEALERELRRSARKGTSLAVCMVDVDHFKRFNDNFGHDAGDAVLREVGAVLQRNIRREDYACRYGGEEFVLLLTEAGFEGALGRADALRRAIAALEIEHRAATLGPVTVSIGVAAAPCHGTDAVTLLAAADAALYEAKRGGRDRVIGAAAASALPALGGQRSEDVIVV